MQTCPKCNAQYEDEQAACPVCGESSFPAEGLTTFLNELRKEREALERQKAGQTQISFELKDQKPAPQPAAKEKKATGAPFWRTAAIVLLTAITFALFFCSPVVCKTGRLWLSGHEQILLFLDNVGIEINFSEEDILYYKEEMPALLTQGETFTAISWFTIVSLAFCLVNMMLSFFTYKYRAGLKWTLFAFSLLATCVNVAAIVFIFIQYGWSYIGWGIALQTELLLLLIVMLLAAYRKEKKTRE